MPTRDVMLTPVFEGASARLTATIAGLTGVGFKPTTCTLLLYDEATGEVINSRTRVNVRDANGGTISSDGALVFELTPDDNVIVTPGRSVQRERHIALFEFTWDSGTKAGKHEVEFTVVDSDQVDDEE
jgi:hypothetical protein